VIDRLGDSEAFLAVGRAFLELATLGKGPCQKATGEHGGKPGQAEALTTEIAFQRLPDTPEQVLGPSILARGEAGSADVELGPDLEGKIRKGFGDGPGSLAECQRFGGLAGDPEIVTHVDRHPTNPPLVVECPGQTFGFLEIPEYLLEFTERNVGSSKIETKIDGLLQRLA
jgi:hypothetical protein